MGRLVRLWNKHEQRVKYDGPDGLTVTGRQVAFSREEMNMPVMKELPQGQYNNVIRMVLNSDRDRVMSLRNATYNTLKRLNLQRDKTKAETVLPKGSDQVDLMSIYVWLNKIKATDVAAIAQLIAIDATTVSRT